MGQYLSIGIATSISVNKEDAMQEGLVSITEVKNVLSEQYNNRNIYDWEEDEKYVRLKLRPDVAEQEWIDFLSDFYQERYRNGRVAHVNMEELKKLNTLDGWLKLANENKYPHYQSDSPFYYYTELPGRYGRGIRTNVSMIDLSLDGKILIECYEGLFHFIERLLRKRFSKYRLSDSLIVALGG